MMMDAKTAQHAPNDVSASEDAKAAFLAAVVESLGAGTFLKITLGKFRGEGTESRITGVRVLLKEVPHLKLVTRRGTQETTRNLGLDAVAGELSSLIGGDYLNATLFTISADIVLAYSRKRVAKLSRGKATLREAPAAEHNRAKAYAVDVTAPYLKALGVTHGGEGGRPVEVKPSMYAKFRQICRFVEILDQLMGASAVREKAAPSIVDIGAGKGYLTFALFDHLVRARAKTPVMRGIEANAALVAACTRIAAQCEMTGLGFEAARVEDAVLGGVGDAPLDVLIALHACDMATDDAIHLGITRGAELIVTAPCCQHELAPQLELGRATGAGTGGARAALGGLLKHGLFRQREADLVTDAMRALLLETQGYEVRVIEFVSTEHTAKNIMLAAVHSARVDRAAARAALDALVEAFGITQQRLLNRLAVVQTAR